MTNPTPTPSPTPSLHDVIMQIQSTEIEKQSLPALPDRIELEGRIRQATEAAVSTPTVETRATLQMLLIERGACNTLHERHREVEKRLAHLREQKAIAEDQQRANQRLSAEREAQEALNEFRMLARQVVRAFRRILSLNMRNRAMGAATVPTPSFSFSHLSSDPNGPFKTSDEMLMGPLRIELVEAEAEKEAA